MPLVYFGLTSSKKEVLRFGHKEKPDGKFGLFGVGSLVHPQAWARPPCQTDTPMVMGEQPNPNTGHPLTSNPSYIEPWAWVKKKLKDVSSILRTIPQKGFKWNKTPSFTHSLTNPTNLPLVRIPFPPVWSQQFCLSQSPSNGQRPPPRGEGTLTTFFERAAIPLKIHV